MRPEEIELDLRLERLRVGRMTSGPAAMMRQICDLSGAIVSTRSSAPTLDGGEGRREVVGAGPDGLGDCDAQFAIAIKERLSAQDG
jgi:hypothetical protein